MPSKTLPPEELLFTSHYSCDIDESPYIVMKKNEYEKLMRFEGGRIPTDYTVAQIGDRFVVLNRHDYRMLVGGLEMIFYLVHAGEGSGGYWGWPLNHGCRSIRGRAAEKESYTAVYCECGGKSR